MSAMYAVRWVLLFITHPRRYLAARYSERAHALWMSREGWKPRTSSSFRCPEEAFAAVYAGDKTGKSYNRALDLSLNHSWKVRARTLARKNRGYDPVGEVLTILTCGTVLSAFGIVAALWALGAFHYCLLLVR